MIIRVAMYKQASRMYSTICVGCLVISLNEHPRKLADAGT